MTQTISRVYSAKDDADAAVKDLKEHHFGDDEIFVCAPAAAGASVEAIAAAIAQNGVLRAQAAALAKDVAAGKTLVTVHAPFGAAVKATALLDRHNPVESAVKPSVHPKPVWDDAAPFSSCFQMPALMNDPAPLSRFWSMPTLTKDRASCSKALGLNEISNNPTPLSTAFGMKLLSNSATPLSSKLGMPVLKS